MVELEQDISTEDNGCVNHGLDTSKLRHLKEGGAVTRSKGKLQLGSVPLEIDESVQHFPRIKKKPYKEVDYGTNFNPTETKNRHQRHMHLGSRHSRDRRSERLKKTTCGPSKIPSKALLSCSNDELLLPSSLQAIPAVKLCDDPWGHIPKYHELDAEHELLRVYHAKLDLMSNVDNPDQADLEWQVESIEEWELKKTKQGQMLFLKVTWSGGQAMGTNGYHEIA